MFDRPLQEAGETALHYSVRTADQTSLHLVDFLVQNRYFLFFKMMFQTKTNWSCIDSQSEFENMKQLRRLFITHASKQNDVFFFGKH